MTKKEREAGTSKRDSSLDHKNVRDLDEQQRRLRRLEELAIREGWYCSKRYWDGVDRIENEWLYRKHPEMR